MESACLGRPTAGAADDVDDSHPPGFPHPLRPPQGDGNLAAARRRDELMLMWELHMERIRQDTILRQLAETERAMAARFGPPGHWPLQALPPSQDYWHHRRPPSLPPWDEAAPVPLRAITGHPPCSFGSPAAARPPPLYPHVERSPSPPPADDGDQEQQECGSPGVEARPMLSGDMDDCRSPSKLTLSQGATLVSAAANAGTGTMTPVSFTEEVTPVDPRAVGEEPKHDVEDGHGVHPFFANGIQSNEQRKTAESTMKDQTDELVARQCQYGPASQESGTSNEQKGIAFREPACQAEGASSSVKRKLMAATSPGTKKQKPQSEWTCHLCQVSVTGLGNLDEQHQASKRHLSKLKARNKQAEATPGSLPLRQNGNESVIECGLSEAESCPMLSSDPECCRLSSKVTLSRGSSLVSVAANAGAGTMTLMSFAEEVTPVDQRAVGEEPKHGAEDGHGVQPFYGSGEQSNEQRETAESIMKDQTDELVAQPCQYRPASQENEASDGQKRIALREPTPPAEGLKRKLTTETSLVTTNKQKPLWTCDLCQVVISPHPRDLVEHQAGRRHRSKLKAIRKKPAEATPGSPPLRTNDDESVAENGGGGGNAPRPADDGDREPAQSTTWTCQGCDAKFNSASSFKEHLAGSLHRENTEAILAKFSSSYRRKDGGGPGMSVYYCKACNVHCTGDTMLASHLVGRRHRRKTPEGRE